MGGRGLISTLHIWHARAEVPGCCITWPPDGGSVSCLPVLHGARRASVGRGPAPASRPCQRSHITQLQTLFRVCITSVFGVDILLHASSTLLITCSCRCRTGWEVFGVSRARQCCCSRSTASLSSHLVTLRCCMMAQATGTNRAVLPQLRFTQQVLSLRSSESPSQCWLGGLKPSSRRGTRNITYGFFIDSVDTNSGWGFRHEGAAQRVRWQLPTSPSRL